MRPLRYTFTFGFFLLLFQISLPSYSQLGIPITIEKPKEYEERVLRSEKSDQKKFNVPRRFVQNTVTHYNYFFNANNKLNEVLERAKTSFVDDYSQLLPFYNYSLDVTAQDSIQLDSIIYKSMSGIALHDLRNDWVDNLYLLWGAAFYLRKEFDSAYMMFQFINYAFAPKEKDGYYLVIGSPRDGNSAMSISTKEKNSLPRRVFSEPPSRNEAFIWQIRNFLVQDKYAEAASLIIALRNDPAFPKRLHNDLHEVQAYWFYKQNMWDSSATHLADALSNATNQQEKARWEYLAAQLFERAGNFKEAEKYYTRVSTHTTDLILDIYARLAAVRVNKDEGDKSIQKNIEALLKMAKRDKYEEYRDIIYYMAAQMELEANNIDGALAMLLKSTQFSSNSPAQRNKVFLQLAELSYDRALYRQSYNFYDSLDIGDPSLKNVDEINSRKNALSILASSLETIARQDSMQRVANMPEEERRDYVRRLARQMRRQQGLKDENTATVNPLTTQPPTNLFGTGNQRGEWYFYNDNSRTRGLAEFKAKWGNRPNVDNWRRSGTIAAGTQILTRLPGANSISGQNEEGGEITFEGLYGRLPLTPEMLQASNDSIREALYLAGKTYVHSIENCTAGTATFEQLRERFPDFDRMDEVLFNLYYCYHKNGEHAKAEAIKKQMGEKFGNSNFTTIINTGKNPQSTGAESEATKTYENIYDLFVEGNFAEAIAQKKTADAKYGNNYWTPQLLYIEAVYYIQQREDSIARKVLGDIISQFPNTPLAERSATLIDVLARRKQIEEELTNMVVTRYADDSTGTTEPPPVKPITVKPATDTTTKAPPPIVNNPPPKPKTDTVAKTVAPPPAKINSPYSWAANAPHYVVLVLNKVDPVFSNEARNAFFRYNRETYYNKTFTLELFQLDADNRLLLFAPFQTLDEAMAYIDKAKPRTASDIIPWLKGGKYTYTVVSAANLDLLKSNKDIEAYKTFVNQYLPGKF